MIIVKFSHEFYDKTDFFIGISTYFSRHELFVFREKRAVKQYVWVLSEYVQFYMAM